MASFRENGDVAEVKHKYKWVRATDDQTFGPFDEEELNIWYNAVYFGPMDEKVKLEGNGETGTRLYPDLHPNLGNYSVHNCALRKM